MDSLIVAHPEARDMALTNEAENIDGLIEGGFIDDIARRGRLGSREKILLMESILLHNWGYGLKWRAFLDAPLIAHADAAVTLDSDAAVAIKNAGFPYGLIFDLIGTPMFEIDYSHHERHMTEPIIDEDDLAKLQKMKDVVLVDVDFVTGKTLRTTTEFLRKKQINVTGAYLGTSAWDGIPCEHFCVGRQTVDFKSFWKKGRSPALRQMRNNQPYIHGLLPHDLMVFSANPNLVDNEEAAASVSMNLARHFINTKHDLIYLGI